VKKSKAFTLIEFLVYITVSTAAIILTTSAISNIFLNKTKLETVAEVNQNAKFILNRIESAIRNADDVSGPALGQSGSTLSLSFSDAALNPTVFSFSSGDIVLQEGESDPVILNSYHTQATALNFQNLSYADASGSIKATITLEFINLSGRRAHEYEQTFSTTTTIRR
jgi:type II secretory pathway pseudopilin PulG